jgi:hypothetical protein
MRNSLLILITIALIAAEVTESRAAMEIAGRVESLTGKVTAHRAQGQEALAAGSTLFVNDRMLTGRDGSAEIVFVDGSRMKVAANANIRILAYDYDAKQKIRHALISMTSGKARFLVKDLEQFNEQGFRVQTETAIVASQNTDFIVSYDPELPRDEVCRNGLTNAFCVEHCILVYSLPFQDKPVLLTANMISQVCGPAWPTPPRFITAAELARILAGLDRIGNAENPPPEKTQKSSGCLPGS